MIGIFDSGAGGIAVTRELRALLPRADIIFLRDRPGAPYGTKSEGEIINLVSHNIELLLSLGAEKILMACCTASTVHQYLTDKLREASVPIIRPTAQRAVEMTKNGAVGVIATDATVRSHAFLKAIRGISSDIKTYEWSAQPLVDIVELGARDGRITDQDLEIIKKTTSDIISSDIDTLVLGCTHFPLIKGTLGKLFPDVSIISSAREGALQMLSSQAEGGRTVYIENRP